MSVEKYCKLVLSDIKNLGLEEFVEVRSFEGLLVNYAKKIDAKIISLPKPNTFLTRFEQNK